MYDTSTNGELIDHGVDSCGPETWVIKLEVMIATIVELVTDDRDLNYRSEGYEFELHTGPSQLFLLSLSSNKALIFAPFHRGANEVKDGGALALVDNDRGGRV